MIKDIENKLIYHGSYTEVRIPDLKKCADGKDFGVGFYTTTDKSQAIRFSRRVARIHGQPYGILNIYQLSNLNGLKVYEFDTTDEQWLHCVVGFRSRARRTLAEPYRQFDVLIGKIADDDTSRVINAYIAGAYGTVGSSQAVQTAISNLIPEALKNQITFRSADSLAKITFKRSERIRL